MDRNACSVIQEISSDEIENEEFLEFALENLDELLSYIESARTNIRIHRDITGEMWFGWRSGLQAISVFVNPLELHLLLEFRNYYISDFWILPASYLKEGN